MTKKICKFPVDEIDSEYGNVPVVLISDSLANHIRFGPYNGVLS